METRQKQHGVHFLLKMFLALFLSSALAVALLLLLTSEPVNLQPTSDNSSSVNNNMARPLHLPPQQLVDLKDFQFIINNDICGRRAVSIAHWVTFWQHFWKMFSLAIFFRRNLVWDFLATFLSTASRGGLKAFQTIQTTSMQNKNLTKKDLHNPFWVPYWVNLKRKKNFSHFFKRPHNLWLLWPVQYQTRWGVMKKNESLDDQNNKREWIDILCQIQWY